MHLMKALSAGVKGGMAMGAWAMSARKMHLSELDMPSYEGSMITGRTEGTDTRMAGMLMHQVLSAMIGVAYAAALSRGVVPRGASGGVILGLLHWLLAGLMLPRMDAMNRTVSEGRTRPLGPFATGYGTGAALMFLVGHIVYGLTVEREYEGAD